MTTLIVPNAWVCQAFYTDGEGSWSNVYGADVGTIPVLTQGNADSLGDVYRDAWDADLKALMPATVSLDRVVVTDVRAEGAPQFVHTVGEVGTAATHKMPDQNAVCITLRTAFRAKSGRGRMYISGLAEGSNAAGGVVEAATKTAVTAFAAALHAGMAGLSWDLGVISRVNPAPGSTGTIRPVTSWEVRGTSWRSQDRRAHVA